MKRTRKNARRRKREREDKKQKTAHMEAIPKVNRESEKEKQLRTPYKTPKAKRERKTTKNN